MNKKLMYLNLDNQLLNPNSFKVHLSETITGYVDVIFDNVELLPETP